MKWFGEPWPDAEDPAGVCSDPKNQVVTPVGQECCMCPELIKESDQGVRIPRGDKPGESEPVHIDCMMRTIMPDWPGMDKITGMEN